MRLLTPVMISKGLMLRLFLQSQQIRLWLPSESNSFLQHMQGLGRSMGFGATCSPACLWAASGGAGTL